MLDFVTRITLALCACVFAGSFSMAQDAPASTNLDDQTSVAVTIYNNNLALVREHRSFPLATGEQHLRFQDVADKIRPETVSLKSLKAEGSIAVLEQNYEYDLISPQKLMEKFVGRDVELRSFNEEGRYEVEQARLLSTNGGPVYEVDGKIYTGHPGTVILPEIPDTLIARPSLIWVVNNTQPEQDVEVTYLTQGMSWKADYVLTLSQRATQCDLSGWVTLNNNAGATYTDATLKVVAGEVNQVPDALGHKMVMEEMAFARGVAAPAPMQEETFAEYHLYTLPRKTTIKQNQSKQVSLLTAEGIACQKAYEFRGRLHYYSNRIEPQKDERPGVFLLFDNEEANNLGVPLPMGIIRVYQEDQSGALQFAGEDNINHTPKNEEVRVKLGQAFDIVGERIQTDYKTLGSNAFEAAFEISIRNRKEEDVTVDIIEPMPADWTILEESHPHQKKDAFTAIFSVEAPSGGEIVVSYRVRVKY